MPKLKPSLQLKYSISLLTFVISILTILSLFLYQQFNAILKDAIAVKTKAFEDTLFQQVKEKGLSLAQFLANDLVNPLYFLNMERMAYILKVAKSNPDVEYAYVFEKDGTLIHDGTSELLKLGTILEAPYQKELKTKSFHIAQKDNSLIIIHSIYMGEEFLGYLKLKYSLKIISSETQKIKTIINDLGEQAKNKTLKTIGFFTILFSIVGVVIAIILARGLTKPILKLSEIAQRFGRGENKLIFPEFNSDELSRLGQAFIQMVKQRKEFEDKLRRSNELFHNLAASSPVGIWRSNSEGSWVYLNNKGSEIIEINCDDITKTEWYKNIHPEDLSNVLEKWNFSVTKIKNFSCEFRFLKTNGEIYEVLAQAIPERNELNIPIGYIGTLTDITKIKNLQENIKKSLIEKEILLKELHHRTKNNLQVISSFLHLQTQNHNDPNLKIALKESQNRVFAMALIHEQILNLESFTEINIKEYIQKLVNQLMATYGSSASKVAVDIQVNTPTFGFDKSVYCGLIINELVSNSLKYAFKNHTDNQLFISFSNTSDGKTKLVISDNGVGLPANFSIGDGKSIGLKIVKQLVEYQLDGVFKVNKKNGTEYEIIF